MIGDAKLSGILLEAAGDGAGKVDWMAVGIGVIIKADDSPA